MIQTPFNILIPPLITISAVPCDNTSCITSQNGLDEQQYEWIQDQENLIPNYSKRFSFSDSSTKGKSKQLSLNSQISATRRKSQPWTIKDDAKLIEAISRYGTGNWINVSNVFRGSRTRSQCSQRWFRVLNPQINKAHWSDEEDKKLIAAIEEFGENSWTRAAAVLGNRCDVQCRYRYKQLMKQKNQARESLSDTDINRDSTITMSPVKNKEIDRLNELAITPDLIQNGNHKIVLPSIDHFIQCSNDF